MHAFIRLLLFYNLFIYKSRRIQVEMERLRVASSKLVANTDIQIYFESALKLSLANPLINNHFVIIIQYTPFFLY